MTPETIQQLRADLARDEGTGPIVKGRLLPYFDCCGKFFRACQCAHQGKLTIGHGRNIEDRGISAEEADVLLASDIKDVHAEMRTLFQWTLEMAQNRQRAFANMLFNLGATKLTGFKNTLAAMASGRYMRAASGMRASKWARQVGARAERLAKLMEQG